MANQEISNLWVVIPTYNRESDLIACLESLRNAQVPLNHVIVVDNNSQDGTLEAINKNFSAVHLLALKENKGATGASNIGFREALKRGAAYVLRLDSDTIVAQNFLLPLLSAAEANPDVGVLSPKIYYFEPDDEIWFAGADAHPWHFGAINDHRHEKDNAVIDQNHATDYVWGAAMLIKRRVLELTGGFDTSFFVYFEEVDFCIRVKDLGFKLMVAPKSHIWHKVGSSAQTKWSAYHWNRSKMLLYRKHAKNIFHKLALIIYAYLYIFFSPLIRNRAGNRGPLKSAFLGLSDGMKIRVHKET